MVSTTSRPYRRSHRRCTWNPLSGVIAWGGFLWLTLGIIGLSELAGAADLAYKLRGKPPMQYKEGVVQRQAVRNKSIELLGAHIDVPSANGESLPRWLYIQLPVIHDGREVNLLVRDLSDAYHYRLDGVPSQYWSKGEPFSWSTEDVLGYLGLKMHTLGVVARLQDKVTDTADWIVPAAFFHGTKPREAMGYTFTFALANPSDGRCVVSYQDREIFRESFEDVSNTFACRWSAQEAQDGLYKLVVTGTFTDTNQLFHYVAWFRHQRDLPR
jgi:hypothetical protein